jgi:putative Holliday junction resolvase
VKILSIDYGSRRVGMAMAGELAVAIPHGALANDADLYKNLAELIQSEAVELIIVGDPRTLRGEAGPMSQAVTEFVDKLSALTTIPIKRVDERYTSHTAKQALIAGTSRKKREKKRRDGSLDAMAAALILSAWLEGNPT